MDFFFNIISFSSATAVTNLCWSHIALNVLGSKKDKLVHFHFLSKAQKDITQLHLARSEIQFDVLGASMIAHWRLNGESDLADWFKKE
jgi:hypothetical protein